MRWHIKKAYLHLTFAYKTPMSEQRVETKTNAPALDKPLQDKYRQLPQIVHTAGSAAVAFSGGVDSMFLLKVCADVSEKKVLGVTARSETYPKRELNEARKLAQQIGAQHILINSEELNVPGFSDNPPNRCFLCKHELLSRIKAIANDRDLQGYRSGSMNEVLDLVKITISDSS